MKKVLLILCLICLTSCQSKENIVKDKNNSSVENSSEVINDEVDKYVDDNNITVGFYLDKKSSRELITDYNDSFTKFTDIGSFFVNIAVPEYPLLTALFQYS